MPFDPEKPTVTSGIRVGSPAGTTRGFGVAEFRAIGRLMPRCWTGSPPTARMATRKVEAKVKAEAIELCRRFPIYA